MHQRRSLVLLFTANGISGFAQGITMLSVPWYFAQQGNSSYFNLIYGIITAVTIFWGLAAGTIVDRFDRKSVFVINNAVEGGIILSVAAYGLWANYMPTCFIILVFAVTIFGFYLHYPNLYAFAHEIITEDEYTKVTSAIEIVGQITSVLAGAGAAVLLEGIDIQQTWDLEVQTIVVDWHVEPWSMQRIFMMDGITYYISVVLISMIRYTPVYQRSIENKTFIKRLYDGFTYLQSHPMVFLFGIFSHSILAVTIVELHVLAPLYITNHLQAGGYVFGAAKLLYAIGALAAGAFVGIFFRQFIALKAIIVLMLLTTLALILNTLSQSVAVYFGVGLLIGFTSAGARVLRLSFLFRCIPNQIIGRANSIFDIINVVNRTLFILILSISYFSIDSHILWGYTLMAVFVLASTAILVVYYRNILKTVQ